jgi:hypothetical protein
MRVHLTLTTTRNHAMRARDHASATSGLPISMAHEFVSGMAVIEPGMKNAFLINMNLGRHRRRSQPRKFLAEAPGMKDIAIHERYERGTRGGWPRNHT